MPLSRLARPPSLIQSSPHTSLVAVLHPCCTACRRLHTSSERLCCLASSGSLWVEFWAATRVWIAACIARARMSFGASDVGSNLMHDDGRVGVFGGSSTTPAAIGEQIANFS